MVSVALAAVVVGSTAVYFGYGQLLGMEVAAAVAASVPVALAVVVLASVKYALVAGVQTLPVVAQPLLVALAEIWAVAQPQRGAYSLASAGPGARGWCS